MREPGGRGVSREEEQEGSDTGNGDRLGAGRESSGETRRIPSDVRDLGPENPGTCRCQEPERGHMRRAGVGQFTLAPC